MEPAMQFSFPIAGRGGFRPASGRKRGSRVSHHGRELLAAAAVLHAIWRVAGDVRSLRGKRLFRQVREAFRRCCEKEGFRLVYFSVQGTHVHLIVEAENLERLVRGMQGLGVSIAKRINFVMGRSGAVFRDRYYSRQLRTPREVANALEHVLCNDRHHRRLPPVDWRRALDPLPFTSLCERVGDRIRAPKLWLLRVGWWHRPDLSPWQAAFALRVA